MTTGRIAALPLRLAIQAYQRLLAPFLGANCRYLPSCSQYALEALELHGTVRGGMLALGRILRCHPWGGAGLDPVPHAPHGRVALSANNEARIGNDR